MKHRRVVPLLALAMVAGCTASSTERASPTLGDGRNDTASPTERSTVTPAASPRPSPAAPAAGPSRLVEHGDRASAEVALTFTVGYRLDPAVGILELLQERGVAATVFMSGIVFDQDATRATAERVLQIIAARPDLSKLGQHGYSATELAGLRGRRPRPRSGPGWLDRAAHLGGWNTLPALPAILDGLAVRGLRPVTVAELLGEP